MARTDGRAGFVDASVHFVPDQNLLDVDISASEPTGGIIANLLKLPGEPAVDIKLQGSGPAADWAGKGTFAVDGVVVTEIEGRHRLTGEGNVVEARGDGDFARFLPEAFRPLAGGHDQSSTSQARRHRPAASISSAPASKAMRVRGTASGMIDPEGASDFALELTSKAETGVPLSFGTAESPIDMVVQSASVRAIGAGDEPNLDIVAALARVENQLGRDRQSGGHAAFRRLQHQEPHRPGDRQCGRPRRSSSTIPSIAPLVAGKVSVDLAGTLSEDTLTVAERQAVQRCAWRGRSAAASRSPTARSTLDLNADVASAALPAAVARPARRTRRDRRSHRARCRRACFRQPVLRSPRAA